MSRIQQYKAMNVDLLSAIMSQNCIFSICDLVCGEDCRALPTLQMSSEEVYRRIIRDWLNAEP